MKKKTDSEILTSLLNSAQRVLDTSVYYDPFRGGFITPEAEFNALRKAMNNYYKRFVVRDKKPKPSK